jgi:alpha-glucuronidase
VAQGCAVAGQFEFYILGVGYMEHILVDFEGFKYWIEVDEEGYALRQITVDGEKILVSCRDDCLSEGIVDTENDCVKITEKDFENVWSDATEKSRQIWNTEKQKYVIGQNVSGVIKYLYPQGAIFDINKLQGCGDISHLDFGLVYSGKEINGIVSGFDDINMWLLIDSCRID